MHFDTTLNLAWVLLGLIALASTVHAEMRRVGSDLSRSRWLHVIGVGLIIAALFPYISATDDILRIEHFSSALEQDAAGQQATEGHGDPSDKAPAKQTPQKSSDDLMRLYETMDSPLVVRFCEIGLTFLFIALVLVLSVREIQRFTLLRAGRSPPAPVR